MSKPRRFTDAPTPKSASERAAHAQVPDDPKVASEAKWQHLLTADSGKRAISLKIGVIARQLRNLFDHAVERDGLSRGKWRVIAVVARVPGATQRSIATMLEITEVTAGQLIDRLCVDGYLERREHPKDRRAYSVHLTQAAEPLLVRLDEIAKMLEEGIFAGLGEQDLRQLDALLEVIARNLAACRERGDERKPSENPVGDG